MWLHIMQRFECIFSFEVDGWRGLAKWNGVSAWQNEKLIFSHDGDLLFDVAAFAASLILLSPHHHHFHLFEEHKKSMMLTTTTQLSEDAGTCRAYIRSHLDSHPLLFFLAAALITTPQDIRRARFSNKLTTHLRSIYKNHFKVAQMHSLSHLICELRMMWLTNVPQKINFAATLNEIFSSCYSCG